MSNQAQKRGRAEYEDSDYASQSTKPQSLNWDDEEIERKVKTLCRYVLACEYKKTTIRRDNINKLILPDNRKLFGELIQRTNARLRDVFGFELQEASLYDKGENQESHLLATQGASTQGASAQQPLKTSTAGTYFLRNIIKEHYILPEIVERPKEEYAQTGVLYTILALLFANEYQMNSIDLNEHLDRLKVTKYGAGDIGERDKLLDGFIKNHYLKRIKVDDQEGEETEYMFSWGSRAYSELPCQNIVGFISSFYNLEDDEKEEFHRKLYQAGGYSLQQ